MSCLESISRLWRTQCPHINAIPFELCSGHGQVDSWFSDSSWYTQVLLWFYKHPSANLMSLFTSFAWVASRRVILTSSTIIMDMFLPYRICVSASTLIISFYLSPHSVSWHSQFKLGTVIDARSRVFICVCEWMCALPHFVDTLSIASDLRGVFAGRGSSMWNKMNMNARGLKAEPIG